MWLGYQLGWRAAHIWVARECERLGGFFVNDATYRCELVRKEPKPDLYPKIPDKPEHLRRHQPTSGNGK